jgi:hypothetical protein
MRTRLEIILLSFGIALLVYTIIGRETAMLLHHSVGNGVPLWLLVPSFLLISIGGDRNVWRKTEAELVPVSTWFAPNS